MSPQSRRFLLSGFSESNVAVVFQRLRNLNPDFLSFLCHDGEKIYVETRLRRAPNSVRNQTAADADIEIEMVHFNPISDEQMQDSCGSSMTKIGVKTDVDVDKLISPTEAHNYYRKFNRPPPELVDAFIPHGKKREYDYAICEAKRKNRREEYAVEPYEWQHKVLQLVRNEDSREVVWVFDKSGNTGKTELCKILEKEGYQYLQGKVLDRLYHAAKHNAAGYAVDISRAGYKKMKDVVEFAEAVKNMRLQDPMYEGMDKFLDSDKIVIVANFMPNLALLSLNRWRIFHTTLGEICLNCEPLNGNLNYKCTISLEMQSAVHDSSALPCEGDVTDATLCAQYLNCFSGSLRVLSDNSIAFPKLAREKGVIRRFLASGDVVAAEQFIVKNRLLEGSIARNEDIIRHLASVSSYAEDDDSSTSPGSESNTLESGELADRGFVDLHQRQMSTSLVSNEGGERSVQDSFKSADGSTGNGNSSSFGYPYTSSVEETWKEMSTHAAEVQSNKLLSDPVIAALNLNSPNPSEMLAGCRADVSSWHPQFGLPVDMANVSMDFPGLIPDLDLLSSTQPNAYCLEDFDSGLL